MTKNEKLYQKYKDKFSFLFDDKYIKEAKTNHFDKNDSFIMFLIALVQNRINEEAVNKHLKINKDEWCELFCHLYSNQEITRLFKKLELNPIVPLEQIVGDFDCFNSFIDEFINFLKKHELNLNAPEENVKSIIKSAFGYLLYNKIDCKLPYSIPDILSDKDYDTKYQAIVNNTKLFAKVKKEIINNCKDKINDLIVLLLGMNQSLNNDK